MAMPCIGMSSAQEMPTPDGRDDHVGRYRHSQERPAAGDMVHGITWFGDSGPHLDRQNPLARYSGATARMTTSVPTRGHIINAATYYPGMRNTAIWANLITVDTRHGRCPAAASPLSSRPGQPASSAASGAASCSSSVRNLATRFLAEGGRPTAQQVAELTMLGRYFAEHPQPPWVTGSVDAWPGFFVGSSRNAGQPYQPLDPMLYLGSGLAPHRWPRAMSERTPPGKALSGSAPSVASTPTGTSAAGNWTAATT